VKTHGQATGLGLVACLLMILGGCATHAPLIDPSTAPVELVDTPFHPQTSHQCGPSTLATMLGASKVRVTPEELEPQVYLPGRKGSLQVEMMAASRRYGRLSYRIQPELAAIVAELNAGRPVLVLHNYGLPSWPRWHYAVVIGYDAGKDQLLLRSGLERRDVWSSRNFMRAWDNADRWAMVVLQPGELPMAPEKVRYLEAAAAFEKVAAPPDAWRAFDAATSAWPDEPVAWIGRGTAGFRQGDYSAAAADYSSALLLEPDNAGARNNLAMAQLKRGCPHAALRSLDMIDGASLGGALDEAVADTRRLVESVLENPDAPFCAP
jgi:tetratricopeptide (TPR) repeat protein